MGYLFAILLGYALGCSSMALYISKLKKTDMRKAGSGNLGASNTTVLFGWKAGMLVGIHDIGKAALAVYLADLLFPGLEHVGAAAGVAAVMGHMFPVYLKFRGGKGFATYIGMTLVLNWKLALIVMALIVVITLVTDYIVWGTMTTIVTVPVYMGIAHRSLLLAAILAVATLCIFVKHWENFPKIFNGTELGLRSAIRGENRIKE